MQYLSEFLLLATALQMALISPGPDFMITIKQTINQGKKYAYYSSLGIGFGIVIHLVYTFLGFGLIIKVFPDFLNFVRILGAIYLIYLGIGSFRSNSSKIKIKSEKDKQYSFKKSFILGFLCNLLNPKATLFFLSIFTTIVSINTPFYIQGLYGLYCVLANILWYILIANILSQKKNMELFNKYRNIIDKFIGTVLILLGLKIIF
ncbi:LysE family translocator [Aliarcobacter vitoriensis]|uniref:Lysine transporter LysE n=1 Tax=Aliarcobacter vitoriensis TaxID=2011099 RepID=A0A366MTI2_9BACT|nr:LysE family translocator [Aliarcobacter vitoriensis]RBQ29578.1 lysine transporter LysE [Aliarcobacter vitoriensis]